MGGKVAAVLVLVAIAAPVAHAGVRVDYRQAFTSARPGRSTGTDTRLLYKNPSDPKAKPIPVREEVFTFPAGTTYDESVVPDCTASDLEIMLRARGACPAASWLGGSKGDTGMTGFPGPDTAIDVDGWDDHGELILFGRDHQFGIGAVTRARRKGQTVTVEVPRTPGGPPDGETALRRIHHVFAARSVGTRAYMRTPRKCPSSHVWTFRAKFTFADGAVERDAYRMRCVPTKKPTPEHPPTRHQGEDRD